MESRTLTDVYYKNKKRPASPNSHVAPTTVRASFWKKLYERFIQGSVQEFHHHDHVHQWLLRITGFSVVCLMVTMLGLLLKMSWPAISKFGFEFIFTNDWDPYREVYGALPFIYGTVVTSFLALALAAPFGLGLALFITELCPPKMRFIVTFIIEILSSIPSIVYGLWGLFFLTPLVREKLAPFLQETLGLSEVPLFKGVSFGIGLLTASIILSIMVIPTITSISVEIFKSMRPDLKHAALALGATRWESIRMAVLRPALTGVFGALVLGLGRALGETMAVAMVIGNKAAISFSLFATGATMASVLANEYAEAATPLHLASLSYVGLLLFFISFLINLCARFIVWRMKA